MISSSQPFDLSPSSEVVTCTSISTQNLDQPWQSHPEFEIMFIISGQVDCRIGSHLSEAHAGDLILVGCHLPHSFSSAINRREPPVPVEAISISFTPELLGPWLHFADAAPLQNLFHTSTRGLLVRGATHQKITAALPSFTLNQGVPRLIQLLEILNELSTHPEDLLALTTATSTALPPPTAQHRLHRITRFIQKRLGDPLYLQDVARHVGMSSVTLSRYLRQHLRKTFPAYLNELRINRICHLLRDTDATITEIAFHCGFDSMANFERQFRKLQGCSPKIYRRQPQTYSTPLFVQSPHQPLPPSITSQPLG